MAAPPPLGQSGPHFEVRILGPFHVYRDGVRLPTDHWQRRISRLFKLLVTAPDRRLARDDLIDTLWPHASPQAGASNLRLLVHLLRQSLAGNESAAGNPIGDTRAPGVVTQGGWVALNQDWVWEVDLDRFELLARSEEFRQREEAAALYSGEPLPEDRYDDWAAPLRERIHRTWRQLCLELARDSSCRGDPEHAVPWLEDILECDPLDEEALRELLSLLAQLGRRAEALQRYRRFEQRLNEELDLRPAQETLAVVDRLRTAAEFQASSSVPSTRPDLSWQIVPVRPSYPFPSAQTLVGREAQLKQLLDELDESGTDASGDEEKGHGPRLALLEAEAGMGKSQLLGEVARRARTRGFLTLAGGCYEQEGALPYGPIHDALLDYLQAQPRNLLDLQLGELVPDLLRIVPEARDYGEEPRPGQGRIGQDERLRLFSALTRVFERISGDKPLVLLLDDLHWADDSTLQLLHFLLRQHRLSRFLVVGAYRAEEVAEGTPLARLVTETRERSPSHIIALDRLSHTGLLVILEDRLGGPCSDQLARAIYARSAGNPFFAVQMMRLLQQEGRISQAERGWDFQAEAEFELPAAVREVIARRLRRLDRAERETLTLAAVLGREFEYPALESMWLGSEDELFAALDATVHAQVLSESESGYVFRHPLLWDVVYERTPAHRRPGLHRRAALALEAIRGDQADDHAAELAWHARVAGDTHRALRYSLQAADHAAAAFAHDEAEQQYEAALDLARQLQDINAEGAALEGLGRVLTVVGRFDEALALLERAAGMWHEIDDIDREARAVALLGWVYHFAGMKDSGRARVQSFLDAAGEQLAPDTLATLHMVLSNLHVTEGTEEHLRVATQASKHARSTGRSEFLAEAEVVRGAALVRLGRYDEALRTLEGAMPLAEDARDLFALVRALDNSSWLHILLGEFNAASLQAERGLELARREGHTVQIIYLTDMLARVASYRGDWDLAQQLWQEAVPMARSLGPSRISADPFVGIGLLRLHQGRDEEAAQYLAECIALAEAAQDPDNVQTAKIAVAEQDLMHGNPRAALDRMAGFSDESSAKTYRDCSLLTVLAQTHLALGDTPRAEEIVKRGLERATAYRERLGAARMLWLRGKILAGEGPWPEAERTLNQAISLSQELPYPFIEALALAELGTGYLRRGEGRPGQERLEAALAVFQRLKARPHIEQTRQTLERLTPPGAEAVRKVRQ